jgi:hypothetical protein
VNPEQASKGVMWMSTLLHRGEDQADAGYPRRTLARSTGVMGAARDEDDWDDVGDPLVVRGRDPRCRSGRHATAGVGEAHSTCETGNDGGGIGPHFGVLPKRARVRGLA